MKRAIRAIAAMGTRFELVLEAPDATWNPDAVAHAAAHIEALGEACAQEILHWHRALTRFEKDSLVSFLNREAHLRAVRVDPRLARALAISREVFDRSEGAFDPVSVGGTLADVEVTSDSVRFNAPALSLDLGGLAKGLALDAVQEVLSEAEGPISAFIHGGTSSVLALGAPRLEPGHPRVRTRKGDVAVPLSPEASPHHLSVSSARPAELSSADVGSHLRAWGRPLPAHARTAAVRLSGTITDAGVWAEAWSTALCVSGNIEHFRMWAQSAGLAAWAMIDDGAGIRECDLNTPGLSVPEALEFV
jgi:thiamine biosynthesis lipoprotein ApbE